MLLTWGSNRFGAVKVNHQARKQGASGYTFRKLATHAMNMMTGLTVPLQFASIVGFCFTLVGVGILFYVTIRYFLSGDAVPGFPFLASIIAIFSGAQLFALGIIGEYLARMHFRMYGPADLRHSRSHRPPRKAKEQPDGLSHPLQPAVPGGR